MIDVKAIDDIVQRLSANLPDGVKTVQKDVEKNFKTVLQNTFSRMDLVTREEFDVQAAVLQRTREKLDLMENQIIALEAKLNSNNPQ